MIENKPKKGPIIFFCKDCEQIVDTIQVGRKYVYKCKKCGTKNVAFGTERSISSFFRLEEKEKKEKMEKGLEMKKLEKKEDKKEDKKSDKKGE